MSLHACKKCQIVNEEVELYYYENKWEGPPEYLCVECQKNAFHFYVFMLILGTIMNKAKSKDIKEDTRKMLERIRAHAKKNRISEAYWMKLVDREVSKLKAAQKATEN